MTISSCISKIIKKTRTIFLTFEIIRLLIFFVLKNICLINSDRYIKINNDCYIKINNRDFQIRITLKIEIIARIHNTHTTKKFSNQKTFILKKSTRNIKSTKSTQSRKLSYITRKKRRKLKLIKILRSFSSRITIIRILFLLKN